METTIVKNKQTRASTHSLILKEKETSKHLCVEPLLQILQFKSMRNFIEKPSLYLSSQFCNLTIPKSQFKKPNSPKIQNYPLTMAAMKSYHR
jgi:hypothetical protein